ncbi:Hypothetical protein CPI37_1258 [Corynebacterium pseudotuberculosis]|nr:Hypothetical protein CPI37_1258 [Corynebacterium pseudotuberculosis]
MLSLHGLKCDAKHKISVRECQFLRKMVRFSDKKLNGSRDLKTIVTHAENQINL